MPVAKEVDSLVYGGTINHNGMLHIRAIATASNSMLASIGRLVEQAQASKPAIQRTADKVAMVFIPMVVIVTLVVLVVWLALAYSGAVDTQGMEGFPFALQFTLAVLVVSCPCAIGLAAPTAIMVATGSGSEKGHPVQGWSHFGSRSLGEYCGIRQDRHALSWQTPSHRLCILGDRSRRWRLFLAVVASHRSGRERKRTSISTSDDEIRRERVLPQRVRHSRAVRIGTW